MNKAATGKPVQMFPIRCFLGERENRRTISLPKLVNFKQRLKLVPT